MYNMAFIAMADFVDGYLEDGIDQWLAAGMETETISQISVQRLRTLLDDGVQLLDARETDEWEEGHIRGVENISYTSLVPQLDIPARIDELTFDKSQPVAVICATGNRSNTAIGVLRRHGYVKLYNVTGGMEAWENAGHEMVDGAGQVCKI